jgi:plastocyanin
MRSLSWQGQDSLGRLVGADGQGFTITLKQGTRPVRPLKPGARAPRVRLRSALDHDEGVVQGRLRNRFGRGGVCRDMKAMITALAVVAVAFAVTGGASSMALPKLYGTVGPGFTISLKQGAKRTPVRTLKAGTYTFVIADKASIHNFQVEGPGVDRAVTTVGFTGTKTVTVRLRRGSYKFYCRPHESTMFGHFRVT